MSLPLVILAAAFGAAAAAFVPRVAHRLAVPVGAAARSACANCARPFSPGLDGWVRAGPPCSCGPAPWRAVLGSAAAAGLLGAAEGPTPLLPVLLLAVVLGALLVEIDMRCLRLPDRVVGVLAALVTGPLTALGLGLGEPQRLGRALLAAVLVGLAYLMVAILPGGGLGLGDVKLAAVLGFLLGYLGWPAVAIGLVAPHLINGPVVLFLLLTRRARRGTALPFGPALLGGALAAVALTAG
jgi:leader peptidase (prepilin peptidase) / N-methyltransferase